MSIFDGILREYPFISVDQFTQENLSSSIFFLSHCHSDHMRGLANQSLYEHLQQRPGTKIYMSYVSKVLLENDDCYRHLSPYMESLPMEATSVVSTPENDSQEVVHVSVTLLPSGHCPGSVMFLFEGNSGTVLYTGDFRIEPEDIKRFRPLHYGNGRIKNIDKIYLDATFCDERSLHIPSRKESLDSLVSLVKPWVEKGRDHIVFLQCPARYGYEYIFIALHEMLGIKTHVPEHKFHRYRKIPDVCKAVTSNPSGTQIHSCESRAPETVYRTGQTECGYSTSDRRPIRVRKIKLSAMFYTCNIKMENISSYDYRSEMFRVCYSTHSSLAEVCCVLNYLKPKALHLCAFPDSKTEEEILELLSPFICADDSHKNEFLMPSLGVLKCSSAENNDDPGSFGSLNFDYTVRESLSAIIKSSGRGTVEQKASELSRENDSSHVLGSDRAVASETTKNSKQEVIESSRTKIFSMVFDDSQFFGSAQKKRVTVTREMGESECRVAAPGEPYTGSHKRESRSAADDRSTSGVAFSESDDILSAHEENSSSELELSFDEISSISRDFPRPNLIANSSSISENAPKWESLTLSPGASDDDDAIGDHGHCRDVTSNTSSRDIVTAAPLDSTTTDCDNSVRGPSQIKNTDLCQASAEAHSSVLSEGCSNGSSTQQKQRFSHTGKASLTGDLQRNQRSSDCYSALSLRSSDETPDLPELESADKICAERPSTLGGSSNSTTEADGMTDDEPRSQSLLSTSECNLFKTEAYAKEQGSRSKLVHAPADALSPAVTGVKGGLDMIHSGFPSPSCDRSSDCDAICDSVRNSKDKRTEIISVSSSPDEDYGPNIFEDKWYCYKVSSNCQSKNRSHVFSEHERVPSKHRRIQSVEMLSADCKRPHSSHCIPVITLDD